MYASQPVKGPFSVSLTLSAHESSGFDADDIKGTLGPRTFTAPFGNPSDRAVLRIPTIKDTTAEGDEAYRITLNAGTAYELGTKKTADGVLADFVPTVSVPATLAVAENAGNATLTITTEEAFGVETTFNVSYGSTASTSDADATGAAFPANGDYDNDAVTTVRFGARDRTKNISIPITDDALAEGDETFTVTIAAVGFSSSTATTTVTITDDDASPVLTAIEDVTLRVGQTVDITASATDADDGDTISYAWSRKAGETTPAIPQGTALNQAQLTFATTAAGTYTMTVTASDGNGNSATEDVVITVSAAATVSVPATLAVTEGTDSSATVRVTASAALGKSVTFDVSYGGTATGAANPSNGDYDNDAATSVAFGASDTTKDIVIPITDDNEDEAAETITVTIALAQGSTLPAGFALGNTATTVTITDDDASPVLTAIEDVTLRVGQTVDITASATDADTGDTITYAWKRKAGETTPALPGSAKLNQARLTFATTATGAYTMTVTASDGGGNSDTEDVVITVTPALGVTVTPTSLTIDEGSSKTYSVKLDTEPSGNVTVTVVDASGDDVSVNPKSLTFTDQNYGTAQTVTVRAAADEDAETDAAVTLTHSATGGGYNGVTIDSVTVTITETTPVLQLKKDPSAVTEGTAISLTVTSDKALTGTLQVSLTLAARGGSDFDADDITGALTQTLTATFGQPASRTGTVSIPTSSDSDAEGAETYRITLNDTAAYELGTDKTADGTLNDPAPVAPCKIGVTNVRTTADDSFPGLAFYTLSFGVRIPANCGAITGLQYQVKTSSRQWRDVSWTDFESIGTDGFADSGSVRTPSGREIVVLGAGGRAARQVRVRALNGSRAGPSSDESTGTFDPPSAPTGLSAAAGAGSATLTWNAQTGEGITAWVINYKRVSEAWRYQVVNAGGNATSATVRGLAAEAYTFRLKARNANGDSGWSATATATAMAATTAPAAPKGLFAQAGAGSATLTWFDPQGGCPVGC